MASLLELFDPDQPNQLIAVTRRSAHNLSDYVLGTHINWYIQTNVTPPGYYIHIEDLNEYDTVELIDFYWHCVYTTGGSYYTCLADRIEPEQEGSGFWRITDPQHPQYIAPSQHPLLPFLVALSSTAGLSRLSERVRTPTPVLTTPREPRRISLEEDELSPYSAFADNPDLSPESPRDVHLVSTLERQ